MDRRSCHGCGLDGSSGKRVVFLVALLSALLTLVLSAGALAASESFVTTQLTSNSYSESGPQVSGDRVVWQGSDGIFTWTPAGGAVQLTTNGYSAEFPRVSGDRIVWMAKDDFDFEIFTWTPTGGTVQLTTNYGRDEGIPEVSGDRIAWRGWDGNDKEIFTWTPAGGTVQVTTNGCGGGVLVSGDRIVWDAWDGDCEGMWTWTPVRGPVRLTTNGKDTYLGGISGDRIVWERFDGHDPQVFTWTPAGGTVQLTKSGYGGEDARVSGDRIVWYGWDGNDEQIFTWTPAEGTVKLTTNQGDYVQTAVSGDRVVWWDTKDEEVFTWTPAGGTVQLTTNHRDVEDVVVSGDRIVWLGWDGNDYEIFTAVPDSTVPDSTFAPIPNGYKFANEAYKDASAGRRAWTHLFGPSLFYGTEGLASWDWILHPTYPQMEGLFDGGVCYGLASTSLAAYGGVLDPSRFKQGATTLYGLGDFGITKKADEDIKQKLPPSLKSTIEEYHVVQQARAADDVFDANRLYQSNDGTSPKTMREFTDSLREALNDGPVLLAIWGAQSIGPPTGHAVVAIGMTMDASGLGGRILIHDNNHPGVSDQVEFTLSGSGTWSYPGLFQEERSISYIPIGTIQALVDAPAGTVEYDPNWTSVSSDASVAFVGAAGKATGRVNGVYVEDNPLVRLDPILDGGLGVHDSDRYSVEGTSTRMFRLESEGTDPAWASARGSAGGYVLQVEGSLQVAAAYQGNDVSFSGAAAEEIRVAVEDGSSLGAVVFRPDTTAAALAPAAAGAGTVRLYGTSGVEVKASSIALGEVVLGTESQTLTIKDIPAARALRAELSDFSAARGEITLDLDLDGNGTYEASEEVPAEQTAAATFTDISSSPYKTAIQTMAGLGIISGYGDGRFGPNNLVMRKHFAKMIVGVMDLPVSEADWHDANRLFTDCGKDDLTDTYPHDYIAVAKAHGLTLGVTATTFAPDANISRAQVATMVVRAAQNSGIRLNPVGTDYAGIFRSYNNATHAGNVKLAEYNGLLQGLVTSGSASSWMDGKATRGEVAQILYNLRSR